MAFPAGAGLSMPWLEAVGPIPPPSGALALSLEGVARLEPGFRAYPRAPGGAGPSEVTLWSRVCPLIGASGCFLSSRTRCRGRCIAGFRGGQPLHSPGLIASRAGAGRGPVFWQSTLGPLASAPARLNEGGPAIPNETPAPLPAASYSGRWRTAVGWARSSLAAPVRDTHALCTRRGAGLARLAGVGLPDHVSRAWE